MKQVSTANDSFPLALFAALPLTFIYANYRKLLVNFSKLFMFVGLNRSEKKFTIKFTDNLRQLAFSLPHHRLSSADASIALPSAQARFTFREATLPEDGLSEMFCCQRENAVLVGYVRGFCLQACLQGKDRDGGYRQQNRVIVE